ncbi:nitrogenase component 1 [Methanosphaerula subterraneus]|uniref:nitrogenase component 1 n=1 Tax=Methanosphaerula subterraneus TaxID=3350244 RepID=UPI003F85660A
MSERPADLGPGCAGPLVPCAMTGAAACLCGFSGLGVIVHGASGCFFHPSSLLHSKDLHCTYLTEEEVIFGAEERLLSLVQELAPRYPRLAILNTCVPAIMGEDLSSLCCDVPVMVIDCPGFTGGADAGYRAALAVLDPRVDPDADGIGIDGISRIDPFWRGNRDEAVRLLGLAGVGPGTIFAADTVAAVDHASPFSISTNPDLAAPAGDSCGSLLGLDLVDETFASLADRDHRVDYEVIASEVTDAEERIVRACDRYLLRFDPPTVAIFGGHAYAMAAAGMLERYLGADVAAIGVRGLPPEGAGHRVCEATGLDQVTSLLEKAAPDLVLGSSFEERLSPGAAFVGYAPPIRGEVRLAARPCVGVEGALALMEGVLNASIDHAQTRR